jgi:hypothetical protein
MITMSRVNSSRNRQSRRGHRHFVVVPFDRDGDGRASPTANRSSVRPETDEVGRCCPGLSILIEHAEHVGRPAGSRNHTAVASGRLRSARHDVQGTAGLPTQVLAREGYEVAKLAFAAFAGAALAAVLERPG